MIERESQTKMQETRPLSFSPTDQTKLRRRRLQIPNFASLTASIESLSREIEEDREKGIKKREKLFEIIVPIWCVWRSAIGGDELRMKEESFFF